MAELPLDQAVPRFKANEDRLDTFVNSATGYTTSGGTSVQSIQQFLASIGSNGIDFVDNAKARFGTGNDLEIYHSGSGSFIRDTGTGDLTIDGSAISIQTASAERISVSASGIDVTGTVEFDGLSGTGSVTITDIADEDNMASNSATKLATQQSIKAYVDAQVGTADTLSEVLGLGNTTGGTDISVSANDDITFTDSSKAIFGAGSDLQIYHNGANSFIDEVGTGHLFVRANSLRLSNADNSKYYIICDNGGTTKLNYDGSTKLATTSTGIDVTGKAGINVSSPSAYLHIKDDTAANDDYDVQIESFRPNLVFEDISGSTTDYQIFVDSNAMKFLYGDASTNTKLANEVLEINTSGIDVTGVTKTSGSGYNPSNTGWATNASLITSGSYGGGLTMIDGSNAFSVRVDTGGLAMRIAQGATSGALGSDIAVFTNSGLDVTGNIEFDGLSGTGSVTVTDILDEDDMTSDSATALATQQSIKAYVDANAGGGGGLPTTGGTMTGDILFNDGVKAKYGTSSDLQIYHDGSNSYITDSGTGILFLRTNQLQIQSDDGLETYGVFTDNGAVNLYHNGSEKFATTSTGIDVTGAIDVATSGASNTSKGLAIATSGTNFESDGGIISIDHAASGAVTGGYFSKYSAGGTLRHSIKGDGKGYFAGGIDVTGKIQVTSTDPEIFLTDTSTGVDHSIDGNSGVGNLFVHVDKNNEGSDPKLIVNVGAADNLIVATEAGNVGIGHTSPVAKMAILGSSNSTITEANSNLCVEGGGGNGMLFGTLSTTGFKSYIQSGFVSNLGTATYALALNPLGGNVGIGTTTCADKLHVEGNIYLGTSSRSVYTGGGGDLRLQTNTGEVKVLTANGATTNLITSGTGIDIPTSLDVGTTLNVGNATPAGSGTIESHVQSSSTPALITYSGSSSLRTHISFENINGQVGKINTTGTQTFYVTSSDYRLKTDIKPMQGSIDRVKALKPCNFEWVNDGGRVDGFIAHEAQEVVPEAIVGDKDAMQDQQYVESEATGDIYTPAVEATYETIQVELTPAVKATYDEDGNELTPAVDATYEEQQQELIPAIDEVIHSSDVVEPDELEEGQLWRETTEKVMATRQVPDYQGIDQSKIVPLLTSALQDAIAKIEALETRLEALEA